MCSRKIGVLMMGLLCSLGVASQVGAAEQSSAAVGDAAQSASQGKKKQSRSAKSRGENGVEEVYVKGSYTARSMNGATGIEMSLRETPQTITIMTSQMIADKGLVDMEQVLDHVPGVSKVGDASEYSIMYVRGFPLDTGVQVDGMITTPANSGYSGDVSQSIDPVLAERVEVLKGAAGILGGQGEPSATVNMIRKRPTAEPAASLFASYGSWDTLRAEGDVSGLLNDSGSVRVRFVGSHMNGDSYIDRYSREKTVAYAIVEGDVSEQTQVSVAVDNIAVLSDGVYNWSSNPAFYTDGTLIKHDVSFSTGQKWSYRDIKQRSIMPELQHQFDNGWTLRTQYRYADATQRVSNPTFGAYVDKASGNLVSFNGKAYSLFSGRESTTKSFNLMVNGDFSLFDQSHDVVFGYSYSENEFGLRFHYALMPTYNLNNPIVAAPDYSLASAPYNASSTVEVGEQDGAFGTLRFSLGDSVKLMLGGRVSNWSYDSRNLVSGTTTSVSEDNVVTPYAGLVYDVNSFLSLYTSYTGIFKPVSQYGADSNILDPTEGTNTEAGIKMAFFDNDLNISAAVYRANKDNVAEYAGKGQLENGYWIYESVDGVKTDGYEIEIAGAINERWKISGGFTYNTAEDKTGKPRQTYIPSKTFKITNSYDFAGEWEGLTLGASARWQNATYDTVDISAALSSTGEVISVRQQQSAYWLVDVMARYDINDNLSVNLNIDNLFDEFYNRSLWGYADYGDPLSATVGVRYTF